MVVELHVDAREPCNSNNTFSGGESAKSLLAGHTCAVTAGHLCGVAQWPPAVSVLDLSFRDIHTAEKSMRADGRHH